ncbi:MAG: biotin/lipoyl-binding protein, partial [Desulfovibrionaceae bacterium]|nr:biotin/lipoyl-binding protein [Desulfovibrionaceae bacterium]
MAEPLYLEMPEKQKGTGAKAGRRMVLALAVSVVLAVLAVAGWLLAGRLESAHAMLDGMVTPVASDRAGRLEALLVREGDTVTAGQAVARMDMKDYLRHLGQAGREAAA